jgi:hypothetical protein
MSAPARFDAAFSKGARLRQTFDLKNYALLLERLSRRPVRLGNVKRRDLIGSNSGQDVLEAPLIEIAKPIAADSEDELVQ